MNICILAGGSGTRLWPQSRKNLPKQFLPLITNKTLFQNTVERISGLSFIELYVICNEEHRFLVAEQLRELNIKAKIILESQQKNTAPAIGVLSHQIIKKNDKPTLVLAADHFVDNEDEFCSLTREVISGEEIKTSIVLFGVKPTFPATGYGYILPRQKDEMSKVASFSEKPDLTTAEEYLHSDKGYLWNAGMFMFRPSVMIAALAEFAPVINETSERLVENQTHDLDFIRLDPTISEQFPNIPIDIAVLEKSSNVYVKPFDIGWSDVGTWKSLYEVKEKDSNGNASRGDTVSIGTSNSLIFADHKLIVTLGVENLAIIETDDAILVADIHQADQVGSIAKKLAKDGRKEHVIHREVHRPWGKYDSIDLGERHQVKRITVKPGGQLSLQMHHHRAEHWIVVKGTAKVLIADNEKLLSENESTYIPLGTVHRLENPGAIPLEMIEVQSGSYLGEDDIIRFEDNYGRD